MAVVSPGSPAEAVGLRRGRHRPQSGYRPIRSAAQLRNRVGLARIGEQTLTIERGGTTQTLWSRWGPANDANASLGGRTQRR